MHYEFLEPRRLLARTIYVDLNAPAVINDGTSWTNAYKNLTQALYFTSSGDTVRVANGTYKPTTTTNRWASFRLNGGVQLMGGYAGYGASNPDHRDPVTFMTTLSGNIGSTSSRSDDSYRILNIVETVATSVTIDGFKFTGGYDDSEQVSDGTGLYVSCANVTLRNLKFVDIGGWALRATSTDDRGSLTIENCSFIRNAGGIYLSAHFLEPFTPVVKNCIFANNSGSSVSAGKLTISDSTFTDNTDTCLSVSEVTVQSCSFESNHGDLGGAIHASKAIISDSRFVNNSANDGGAVWVFNEARIDRCEFLGNSAARGGAIFHSRDALLRNSSFVGNVADLGGAIYMDDWYTSLSESIINCTFYANSASSGGVVFYQQPSNTTNISLDITNTIAWNNGPSAFDTDDAGTTITYSLIDGGFSGTGNRDLYPKFVNAPSPGADGEWGTSDDNYGDLRLRSNSPAINRGALFTLNLAFVWSDLTGSPRIIDSIVDIGAFEFQGDTFVKFEDHLLTVTGSDEGDQIILDADERKITISLDDAPVQVERALVHDIKIFSGRGNDSIEIKPSDSPIATYIDAGSGNDTVLGGLKSDTVLGGNGNDVVYGATGNDLIKGGDGNDSLYGEPGADRLYGGIGDDSLVGGDSKDQLYGEAGNDRLDGKSGSDLINGGSGTDTAVEDDDDSLVTSIESLQ